MNTIKGNDGLRAEQPSTELGEGKRRLHLSVARMKQLRSKVKGGLERNDTKAADPRSALGAW
jgi:hypothetical protein